MGRGRIDVYIHAKIMYNGVYIFATKTAQKYFTDRANSYAKDNNRIKGAKKYGKPLFFRLPAWYNKR